MTTIHDTQDFTKFQPIVNYDEPPTRPPPALLVGPLGWVRQNLFSSWLDTVLTIVGAIVIISAVTGLVNWIVTQANWFAIIFNLRLLMLGRYEAEAEWRLVVLVMIIAFSVGMALAAWSLLRRGTIILMVIAVALMFILPPVIGATQAPTPTYLTAGNTPITAGSDKLKPQPQLAFIARAGEKVTVQIANDLTSSDNVLESLSGFGDTASNQLRNSAGTRLTNAARMAELQNLLAGDTLTASQRTRDQAELQKLTSTAPITDTYQLNQTSVDVQIIRAATNTVVSEATLDSNSTPLIVTLPEEGWYILKKTVKDPKIDVLLQANGIYPILQRSVNASDNTSADSTSTAATNAAGATTNLQYVRMSDNLITQEPQPVVDGKKVPIADTTNIDFRGDHSVSTYLSLFVAPFLNQINLFFLIVVAFLLTGYFAGRLLDRMISPSQFPRRASGRLATWLLIALPVLTVALVYGVGNILPLTDTQRWGGLLVTLVATVAGIIFSFPIGVLLALGRRSSLPAISLFCTLFIEFVRGVPFITILFMSQLLVPLINPALGATPGIFRAIVGTILFTAAYLAENVRGGLQAVPHGQEEAAKALGLGSFQTTLYITLPQALRIVIPALVGMFIALFIDTSLFVIVGLLDLVGMSNNVVVQTEFLGDRREVLIFITIIYFAISYAISTVSRKIEASGAGQAMARKI